MHFFFRLYLGEMCCNFFYFMYIQLFNEIQFVTWYYYFFPIFNKISGDSM